MKKSAKALFFILVEQKRLYWRQLTKLSASRRIAKWLLPELARLRSKVTQA
tara:strand:+ start:1850 stop:2002 length:153 start_codon:yes stop_codon:yes gene_type:complete